jgi:hypothetical protein
MRSRSQGPRCGLSLFRKGIFGVIGGHDVDIDKCIAVRFVCVCSY